MTIRRLTEEDRKRITCQVCRERPADVVEEPKSGPGFFYHCDQCQAEIDERRRKREEEQITKVDQLSYARTIGEMCPYCGGRDIASDNYFEKGYEGRKEIVRQKTECENCGRAWWDVFVLSHIAELQPEEGTA